MKRLIITVMVTALALLALPALALAATTTTVGVDPVFVPGNPKLCQEGYGYKIDPVPFGETTRDYTLADGTEVTIKIDVYSTAMGQMVDFEVTGAPVDKVVAKGGNGASVYSYDPAVYADAGLHSPINSSGKYADFSHIDFCFTGGGGGGGDYGELCGSKWYDRDMDGVWDESEPAIEGWKISLYKMGESDSYVLAEDAYTGKDGAFCFDTLEPGTYKVVEGVTSGNWIQTFPVDPNHYVGISLAAGMKIDELDFGNVCTRVATGYTMGFWSNKNGAAALKAYGYSDAQIKGIQANFKSAATATDMCVMLNAQKLAHELNTKVSVSGKTADYKGAGVIIDGVVYEYDKVMADYAGFVCGDDNRAEAEWYKDFFDGLNNNWFTLVNWEPCSVPTTWGS
jgi:hypothetical protein